MAREVTAPVHVASTNSETCAAATNLGARVDKMEWKQEAIDKRLSEGAETFGNVRTSIQEIHDKLKPQPIPIWKIVSIAITISLIIGAWVWQAAKYPDRDEFNHARSVSEGKVDAVKTEVNQLKLEQVKVQADVIQIKASQSRTEKDIDEIKKDLKSLTQRRR